MKLIFLAALTSTFGGLLLKKGMLGNPSFLGHGFNLAEIIKTFLSPFIITGLLVYVAGTVIWLKVLSQSDLSRAYPILTATSFTLITLISVIALNEHVSLIRLTGFVGIIAGIILVLRA